MKKHLNPENVAPPAGPYSHVVEAGQYVFLSGQAPLDLETGELFHGTFEEEAILVFNNIKQALKSVNLDFSDVVKVQTHLGNLDHAIRYNEIYKEYFKEPFPARTTVGSLLGRIQIEIDCIAYKSLQKDNK